MFATLQDGTKLFFDTYGSLLSIEADRVIEKPTVVFLHGGPGIADHTLYVPFWSQLADVAQVIFLDMRGHGRSDLGDPADWNLKRWGRDVAEFCDLLGLHSPIIAGFSFGGWVALSYATHFPTHPGKLILCNTEAQIDFPARVEAYRKKGGDEVAEVVKKQAIQSDPELYIKHCLPLFSKHPYTSSELNRCVKNSQVWEHFDRHEYRTFNFLPHLGKITCPTLVLAGSEDPEHPPESAQRMVNGLTNSATQYALIQGAGDPVFRDHPQETLDTLNHFIREE